MITASAQPATQDRSLADRPGRPRRTRQRLVLALKICVSVGLVALLLATSGLDRIGATLAAADLGWLAAGLALGVAAAFLQTYQWRGLLSAFGLRRGYWRCLRLDTAARLFDAALPSSIGGDVVRAGLVTDDRSTMAPAATAVALRRVMSIPGLLLVMGISLVASWPVADATRLRATALVCLGGGVAVAVAIVVVQRMGALARLRLPGRLAGIRRTILEARAAAADGTHPFRRSALRGLLFWVVVVLSQACYVHAVGITAPFAYVAAVVTCVNAVTMAPISVGGYGLREASFSALLGVGAIGTAAQGTAVGLVLSAQTLLFGLVGAVVYLTLRRTAITSTAERAADRPLLRAPQGTL